ncbi:MAG: VWA domain-containing protein [Gammaproteobacteria bacterium]
MPLERRQHYRLEERLEELLAPVLSFSRTATHAARDLVRLQRDRQEYALHWVEVFTKSSFELAFRLAEQFAAAAAELSTANLERWIKSVLDAFDAEGLEGALEVLDRYREFAGDAEGSVCPVTLEEVRHRLEIFLQGLSGRPLHIEPGEEPYTDSEIIYLPALMDRHPDRESNFALYKAMTVHLWAQTRFGTWQVPNFLPVKRDGFDASHLWRMGLWEAIGLSREPGAFIEPTRLIRVFHALETMRLDACIRRELPGMSRVFDAHYQGLGEAGEIDAWREAQERLSQPEASVADSYAMLATLYPCPIPREQSYQGVMHPERVERVRGRRLQAEEEAFRKWVAGVELPAAASPPGGSDEPRTRSADEHTRPQEGEPPNWSPEALDELAAEGRARSLMDSIIQDLGEVPRHYLDAEGDGLYLWSADAAGSASGESDASPSLNAILYPEWDYLRQDYHRDWCRLIERDVPAGDPRFGPRTREKYRGLLKELRRTFSRLREEERLMRRQREGDEVDIDALVASWPDQVRGEESPDGLYVKRHKMERDIAVLFLVDMSGSTKGWVNEAERESLILLCEALQALDDRYAVYGFTGMTRQRCEVFRIKTFDQRYDESVQARISGIRAGEYTRMGVAIRHLSRVLGRVDARVRLLVTLSDGKPDDFDGYSGKYGIEDTRRALAEAVEQGLHTFCVTIDREAREYLSHLYGPTNYAVVDEVASLPRKVADIYRHITT